MVIKLLNVNHIFIEFFVDDKFRMWNGLIIRKESALGVRGGQRDLT